MADPLTLGIAGLGILGTLAGWAKARAEAVRARDQAVEANALRGLENERQETALQAHVMERVKLLEARMEHQSEINARLLEENAALRRKDDEQARLITELTGDNVRQAMRITELERALETSERRAKKLAAELHESLQLAQPSHRTNRPPK